MSVQPDSQAFYRRSSLSQTEEFRRQLMKTIRSLAHEILIMKDRQSGGKLMNGAAKLLACLT